jgi:hypothetical protein
MTFSSGELCSVVSSCLLEIYMNTSTNVSFVDPIDPINLKEVDSFKWRNEIKSQTFEHTKVLWKGNHILTIKKHVDLDRETKTVNDEDDDYEPQEKFEPKIKWLIHTNWDWLKHYYGEFETITEAKAASVKAVEEIASHISKAFAIRKPRAPRS